MPFVRLVVRFTSEFVTFSSKPELLDVRLVVKLATTPAAVGNKVAFSTDGRSVGNREGEMLDTLIGPRDGRRVGNQDKRRDGTKEGSSVGASED